jgi:hypothetical protein
MCDFPCRGSHVPLLMRGSSQIEPNHNTLKNSREFLPCEKTVCICIITSRLTVRSAVPFATESITRPLSVSSSLARPASPSRAAIPPHLRQSCRSVWAVRETLCTTENRPPSFFVSYPIGDSRLSKVGLLSARFHTTWSKMGRVSATFLA